ncbi:MAG: DUF521 domain-containing protein [Candidatus Heimdallarchaeota archaeon]|nr:DUF521 domain-containing protein [Candidatus Heimdallarchaeota archaeon]
MLDTSKFKIKLTQDEITILNGDKGTVLQKMMESVVLYGEIFDAKNLIPIVGSQHTAMAVGATFLKPYYRLLDELIIEKLHSEKPFTANPRAYDFKNIKYPFLEKLVTKLIYAQEPYEKRLLKLGLKDKQAFSCTCYLDEIGNQPKKGDILAWSESSAVVYANSVLGARTNRNSVVIDIFSSILGKTPNFALLTDEGRKASWVIEVKTKTLPNPHILGSVIGEKVIEDVPYIKGLDKFLVAEDDLTIKAYLKDLGAASASSGAVGLYHVENITPEAKDLGEKLLMKDYQTFAITEQILNKAKEEFPILWKNVSAKPKVCIMGCPHFTLEQLYQWKEKIKNKLNFSNNKTVKVQTILCAAPAVVEKFQEDTQAYNELKSTGAKLSSICPLAYMSNPITEKKPVITNSSKLRVYSTARFYPDEEILDKVI